MDNIDKNEVARPKFELNTIPERKCVLQIIILESLKVLNEIILNIFFVGKAK